MSGLATSVTGDGILIAASKTRVLRPVEIVDEEENVIDVQFRIIEEERETREWVALTKEAAMAVVDSAPQPGFGIYSYSASEDLRVVNAYRLVREFVAETDGPLTSLDVADEPTFDPNGGSFGVGDFPVSVKLESATEGVEIRYAVLHDGVLTAWTAVPNGSNITINDPGDGLDRVIYAFSTRPGRQPSNIVNSNPYERDA